jgi:glycine/D-amino acid oxidase-like deaminating enzyme
MIAVIGTGVVGACVGYYLARDGGQVVLVDAGQPGRLTTSTSLAWVNASSKAEHPEYFDLNAAGLAEYDRLLADSRTLGDRWWHPTGHLRWDYADESELVRAVDQLRERGYPAEVWDAARVRRGLEPNVSFASASALVAFLPSEAWVDGPRMVEELVAAAVGKGATAAFGAPVAGIGVDNGAVTSVSLADGRRIRADAVVNAAGPAAASVAALVGRVLPMQERPGLAVRVEAGADCIGRVMHAPGIAMRPDGPGRVFLLTHEVEPALRRPLRPPLELAEEVRVLAGSVVLQLASASVVEARVGYRPVPVDGLPAIGKATDIDGYYEAVTHSGITLGPIIARALSAEILRGHVDPLVTSFRASRLPPNASPRAF